MLVVDWEKSERDPQRRKTASGRLLHCCCICGALEPWGDTWSTYCSFKDMDDGASIPKFCSNNCRQQAGAAARNVTAEMKERARASELREPKIVYREQTAAEKYADARSEQKRKKDRQAVARDLLSGD